MNERFYQDKKIFEKKWSVKEWVYEVYDANTNQILQRFVDYLIYPEVEFPQMLRFWNAREGCGGRVVRERLLSNEYFKD